MTDLRFLDPEALTNRAAFNERFAILNTVAVKKSVPYGPAISTYSEGDVVYFNENGQPIPFYLAKIGYEPAYNTNRALFVRKGFPKDGAWNSSGVNTYDLSTIDSWMNDTYLKTLDPDVQAAIGKTNIPYTPMNGETSVQRIEKAVFPLSATELGYAGGNKEGEVLPIASVLNTGNSVQQWTRTPVTSGTTEAYRVTATAPNFGLQTVSTTSDFYYRPSFTLPLDYAPSIYGLYDLSDNLLLKLPGAQIETGSYTGTGTYGSSNPNSLTFGFAPKMVFVIGGNYKTLGVFSSPVLSAAVSSTSFGSSSVKGLSVSWAGNTVTWYSTSNYSLQLNESGFGYEYVAIG